MIKRPLSPQFRDCVLGGVKTTTIRAKPWPTDWPIMLFHWEGAPYRSKHVDIAAIRVTDVRPITIDHPSEPSLSLLYFYTGKIDERVLWSTEGFVSAQAMDNWFRRVVKPGCSDQLSLMTFELEPTA